MMIIKPPHEISIFSTTLRYESTTEKQVSDILGQADLKTFKWTRNLRLKKSPKHWDSTLWIIIEISKWFYSKIPFEIRTLVMTNTLSLFIPSPIYEPLSALITQGTIILQACMRYILSSTGSEAWLLFDKASRKSSHPW